MKKPSKPVKDWSNLPDLLTVDITALILCVSESSVRRMCRAGSIPAYKIGPRLWRISKRKLMEQMGVRA